VAQLLVLDLAVMARVSVVAGLCLLVYGLWHLVTGRGSPLTPTAVSPSGRAVIMWYGASWLPWAAYFLAGPWLLRPGGSTTHVLLLALCALVLSCAFLLGAGWAQHR
jgi:hypothetical protein